MDDEDGHAWGVEFFHGGFDEGVEVWVGEVFISALRIFRHGDCRFGKYDSGVEKYSDE